MLAGTSDSGVPPPSSSITGLVAGSRGVKRSNGPVSADDAQQLKKSRAESPSHVEPIKIILCSEARCTTEATHFCMDLCGAQCRQHEEAAHLQMSDHTRVSLAEQERKRQLAQETAEAARRLVGCEDHSTAMRAYVTSLTDVTAIASRAKHLKAFQARLDAESAALNAVRQQLPHWARRHAVRQMALTKALEIVGPIREQHLKQYQAMKTAAEAVRNLPAHAVLALSNEEIRRTFDVTTVTAAHAKFEKQWRESELAIPTEPLDVFIAKQLSSLPMLLSLAPELKQKLQAFLPPGKSLVRHNRQASHWRIEVLSAQ
jgi:hypothetical protein